jgi:ResB-like family
MAFDPDHTLTQKPTKSFGQKVFGILSGFPLATILMTILLLQTWLATLEQVDYGLHATLRKYFDPQALYILGELRLPDFMGEKALIIPMPGGYWVLGLFFINLLLGGIVRARKGWKKIGVLISHSGILLMILSAGVTEMTEQRGTMDFFEGESSNVAQDYYEYVVEVSERTAGMPTEVHVIRGEFLSDLRGKPGKPSPIRTVRLPELPFDMQFTHYSKNARVMSVNEMAPPAGAEVIDGYYIFDKPAEKNAELNVAACYGKVMPSEGAAPPSFILSGDAFHPQTIKIGERVFVFQLRKYLWQMPFTVRLDKATAEYYPNSSKPKRFESMVTRIENNSEAKFEIKMNMPMRYEGLTFYQRMMGRENAQVANSRPYSQLEVVRNPADQWPKYALYIVTAGLLVHFVMKFALYIDRSTQSPKRKYG